MDWVQEHCDRLRSKLQHVIDGGGHSRAAGRGLRVPWSWVCRSIIETVRRYPSGLTEAVILAELELLWRRDVKGAFVPGKLQAYLDAQYAPLSEVIPACVVRHSDQLVTLVEDHSGSTSFEHSAARVDMYLHQNFKSCLRYAQDAGHDLLAPGRKVRLTGCRLLTGATAAVAGNGGGGTDRGGEGRGRRPRSSSTLLLTEYLAFVLDHRRSEDLRLAAGAFGQARVRDTFHENSNQEAFFVVCKVMEIRRPRQHSASGGGQQLRKRRQTLQTVVLECAAGARAGQQQRRQQRRAEGLREETGTTSDGGAVGGDGDGGGGTGDGSASRSTDTVLLHLWDEQTCLASLFRKGDGLAVYWPWLVQHQPSNDSAGDLTTLAGGPSSQPLASSQLPLPESSCGWHFEYGSATALFVLPRESREQLFTAASGNGRSELEAPAASSSSSGGGVVFPKKVSPRGGDAGERGREGGGIGETSRAQEMPADENGVRDLLQFPRRVSVSDLSPNMSNVSIYGQVVSVGCLPGASLPAVMPPSRESSSNHNHNKNNNNNNNNNNKKNKMEFNKRQGPSSSSASPPLKPATLVQQPKDGFASLPAGPVAASAVAAETAGKVVELWIRDEGGRARVLCCGRRAAADALTCRPGQYVLACGLRTFAPAFPSANHSGGPQGEVVIFCGEPEDFRRQDAYAGTSAGSASGASRTGGGGGGGGGGGDGLSRILNTSCLEGLLHCPFLSRHSQPHDRKRLPGPRATFACKAAVTWARWTFDGDGLWAIHRRCGARLPCHYSALRASDDGTRKTGRKRPREMRQPGMGGNKRKTGEQQRGACVTCPLCQITVRAACPEDAGLEYAPLLLALDDGARCHVAECRNEVVTAALGGITADVFLQMGPDERRLTLGSLIGREIRCVVGGDGADVDAYSSGRSSERCSPAEVGEGGGEWGGTGRVGLRVEGIASANPAADLAHLLSR